MATKVAILCGGNSPEREISLRSGAAVAKALSANKYEVVALDPAFRSTDYNHLLKLADVVFPVLHGKGGEDGAIQAWLEQKRLPYIGSDAASSRACFDKMKFKQKLLEAGLPVPRGELVDSVTMWESPLINKPFVLKPNDGGSSIDTFIVRDIETYDRNVINEAFGRHRQMLLEELIDGQEITVAILLEEVLPVIEIVPPSDGEFDYDNKYNGRTLELCPPQSISEDTQRQARDLALQVHRLIGARDLSRTDMMVAGDGSLWVLEINTIPGLTDQSLLPKAAAVAGYGMDDVVRMLVENVSSGRRTGRA